ncbi:MAG: hypothetical protein M0R22_04420 [Dehalococcoidia bacterium]|jgi:hypothetical protein|nr:hypothetical protein [Dehalococcoidia bacterium]
MKSCYAIVFLILAVSLFAANCHAKPSQCANCVCPLSALSAPTFRTLTIEVPAVAAVAPEAKPAAVAADGKRLAGKVVAAPVRVVQATREREHKPVVRAVQAVKERERKPVVRAVRFVLKRGR